MSEREDEIQLIIKAPNQNVKDYIVDCNLEWTVGDLKEYLSEEYPNKPDVMDQRLIYSGRLLHNHLHLRDVLRHGENEEPTVHTLHLVCNVNINTRKSQGSSQSWYNQQAQSHMNAAIPSTSAENNLRHRNASFVPPTNPVYSQFQPSTVIPPLTGEAQVLAQITAMQQMYANYVNQYMQSVHTAAVTANSPVSPEPQNFQPIRNNNLNEIPAQRPLNQRMNAQGGQVWEDLDELANRDWLDHLFLCLRYLIIFCIVYFYSTPERLMIVIVCAVIAFLYHEGWFVRRTRPVVAGAADVPRGNTLPLNEEINEANQELSANEELQDGHELEAAMDGNDPPHAQNADLVNNNQICSPLTFLSAFFASLIPEPPPPVNIN